MPGESSMNIGLKVKEEIKTWISCIIVLFVKYPEIHDTPYAVQNVNSMSNYGFIVKL
jgi:hypothetical protein